MALEGLEARLKTGLRRVLGTEDRRGKGKYDIHEKRFHYVSVQDDDQEKFPALLAEEHEEKPSRPAEGRASRTSRFSWACPSSLLVAPRARPEDDQDPVATREAMLPAWQEYTRAAYGLSLWPYTV